MKRATGALLAACTFAEYAGVAEARGWQGKEATRRQLVGVFDS